MKKSILYGIFFLMAVSVAAQTKNEHNAKKEISGKKDSKPSIMHNIYDFKVTDIQGNEFDFASLKGKKIMIVNTASKCGLTPQYKELEELYEKYKGSGFVIVGFPANNFASQEPGTNQEIGAFCQKNYGVTFPMMSKISVVGDDMNQIYQFLTQKKLNGLQDSQVEWNFQKYLIGKNGNLEKVISPKITPMSDEIISWLKS